MRKMVLALLFAILPAWSYAADFALVQSAAPTSATTQDFTSSGFGTPKCALFWMTTATANNSAASHGMLSVGGTDGTNSYAASMLDEDAATSTTDSDEHRSTSATLLSQLSTDQTVNGTATFSAWITDGVRIDWTADPPPSAYLVNALLIGGSGVSNCYVGNASTPTTVDTGTDVTAPGFQPDLVIAWGSHPSSNGSMSIGFAVNDGSNTQRSAGQWSTNGNTTSFISSALLDNRIWTVGYNGIGTIQIQGFDASGFDLYLRDVNGTALTTGYMAIKFSGINAKIVTCASPTSTGTDTCTGAGFTPQLALALQGEWAAVNTYYTTDDGETLAFGGSTSAQSLVGGIYLEDGQSSPYVAKAMTDAVPIHLYKDSADYMVASFSAFTSDGVTWNYSTVPVAAKQRGVLFIQQASRRSISPVILP